MWDVFWTIQRSGNVAMTAESHVQLAVGWKESDIPTNLYICPMECTMIYSHDEMVSSLAHQLQQQPQPPSLSRYARKEISADGVAGGYSMFCNPIRRELIGVQYYERAPQCRVRTVGFVSIPTLNKYEFFLAMAVGRHTGRTGGAASIKKRRRSTA
jgi:hypothetical protein